jgi:hypothetical protein
MSQEESCGQGEYKGIVEPLVFRQESGKAR